MSVDLLAVATARPTGTMTQQQALDLNLKSSALTPRRAGLLERLYRRSTVRRRASVLIGASGEEAPLEALADYYPPATGDNGHGPTVSQRMRRYELEALPLAQKAAAQGIDTAGVGSDEIAQVVTVSCTGFAAPGLDTRLIRKLELRPTVGRSAIGFMGCHGGINGLRVASALASAEPGSSVLLCAVELCTLHFHYGWDGGQAVANTLFADGAAAAILRAGSSRDGSWRLRATGSCLLPNSTEDMGWRIGDHGFEMTLSSRVPSIIQAQLRDWLCDWLAAHDLAPHEVGSWAIHPGGPRVIDAVEKTLDLSPQETAASREVLAEYGNMSSPTVFFILRRLAERKAPRPCVMLAFGPGLVVEAALLE
jgi:predicted naringenin-chalcone synthase